VPDLLGLSLEAACEVAAWAGITIGVSTTERPHGPQGTVVAQAPSPGARVEPRRHVRVLVSVRPAHEPPVAITRTARRRRRWGG
jgi:beta-lactam-binding protein with PASTA domain